MTAVTLRRIAIAAAILTVLVGIDGIYMVATNYHPDDASSNSFHLTDGATVLIAAAILLVVTILAYAMSFRARSVSAEPDPMAKPNSEPEVQG